MSEELKLYLGALDWGEYEKRLNNWKLTMIYDEKTD